MMRLRIKYNNSDFVSSANSFSKLNEAIILLCLKEMYFARFEILDFFLIYPSKSNQS